MVKFQLQFAHLPQLLTGAVTMFALRKDVSSNAQPAMLKILAKLDHLQFD
jgi:hypothetical protein